jgi:hypothetical protein
LTNDSPPTRLSLSAMGIVRAAAWPAAILVIVAHLAWGDVGWPPETHACAGVLGAIALVSCAYIRPFTFPIIALMLVRYYLAMGMPVFSSPRLFTAVYGVIPISGRAKVEAGFAGLLFGIALFLAACLVAPFARRMQAGVSRTLDSRTEYSGRDTIAARFIAILSLASFVLVASKVGRMSELPPSLGLIAAILGNPEFALGFLFWDAYKTRTFSSRVWCWAALAAYTFGGLSTGMVGPTLFPWIGAMVLLWSLHGRLPLKLLVGVTLAVLVLNPAKHTYRQLSWNQNREVGLVERAENWSTAVSKIFDGLSQDTSEASSDAAASVGSRMATLIEVSHMIDWIPGKVPFAGPEAWLNVPLFFVPTLLWPDRPNPTAEFNVKYATTFGIHTREMTTKSTTTPPSVGDGYWRLGWPGVLMEGLTLGIVVGLFHGLASAASRSLTIVGLGFMLSGGGPESCAAALIAGLPKYVIVLGAVLLIAQWLPQALGGQRRSPSLRPSRPHRNAADSLPARTTR